jgi:hypothetical protein
MGMIMSYLVFGITVGRSDRFITVTTTIGILAFLAALNWRFETGLVFFYSALLLGVTLRCIRRDRGKANGDYAAFSEGDYDRAWFDVVIDGIGEYPVLFPPDIGNRKGDRLSGKIVEVGMGLRGKYRGVTVAKVESLSCFYLCPLSSLAPHPSMKRRGSVEIASRSGEKFCSVTFHWYEYGAYTVIFGAR